VNAGVSTACEKVEREKWQKTVMFLDTGGIFGNRKVNQNLPVLLASRRLYGSCDCCAKAVQGLAVQVLPSPPE